MPTVYTHFTVGKVSKTEAPSRCLCACRCLSDAREWVTFILTDAGVPALLAIPAPQ